MNESALYTAGRLIAVVTKPSLLFLAHNFLAANAAQGVATTFLATTLMLMGIGADPHRWFYARYFGKEPVSSSLSFYVYIFSVTQLAVLGSIGTLAIILATTGSASLASAATLYFLSEKLADENLRIRLFERRFTAWGSLNLGRSALQLMFLAVIYEATDGATSSGSVVLALAAGNASIFLPQAPASVWRALLGGTISRRLWLARRSALSLVRNWRLWATALVTSAVGYLDRLAALAVDPDILPLFVLVIMSFSIVQMAVDFYYVSIYRREFLRGEVTLRRAIIHPSLITSLAGGLVTAGVACGVVLGLSNGGDVFPLSYIAGIAVFQLSVAVAMIPQMIVYWSRRFDLVLRVEGAFWMCFLLLAVAIRVVSVDPLALIAVAAVLTVARVATYCVVSLSVAPSSIG